MPLLQLKTVQVVKTFIIIRSHRINGGPMDWETEEAFRRLTTSHLTTDSSICNDWRIKQTFLDVTTTLRGWQGWQ
eukprot:6145962-Ditylum_brightwellii.AAC.1